MGQPLQLSPQEIAEVLASFGRPEPINPAPAPHLLLGSDPGAPLGPQEAEIYLALGCFWGGEKLFWSLPGVSNTAVGYMDGRQVAGARIANPTYEEVCTGLTGYAETVRVRYQVGDGTTLDAILRAFWENHEPDQGDRQGNDLGPQYRSAIFYTTDAQRDRAESSAGQIAAQLRALRGSELTTVLKPATDAGPFYLAEEYHQCYLIKNPNGYCAHGPTGLQCRLG